MIPSKEISPHVVAEKKYFNLKLWRKKYRREHNDEINKKAKEVYKENRGVLRRHILWNLTCSQNTKQPKRSSMEKYNLVFDETLK